ncbi:MAG: acyltransferase [Rhodospirillales bacterium]|nr:acyltransferase [Rhodospirillales bacterium]
MLRSEFLPVRARMRIMRWIGYDIHPSACIWSGAILRSKKLHLGPHAFINIGFFFDGHDHLEIAENVRIGQFVRVLTATHEIGPPDQRCLVGVRSGPVSISKGCWICSSVTILPNINVAEGCVIAAGAVVTRTTTPNGLYAGVPARLVRLLNGHATTTNISQPC